MPFQDLINLHFTAADQGQADSLIGQLEALLQPNLRNLSAEENNTVGSINETNKLLVNKVRDYRGSQPALSSPDVDWVEYMADYMDRTFLETYALRLQALATAMLETKRLHDHDNYQNALIDYGYTQYKNKTSPGLGYDTKEAELKQFFPATGTGGGTTPTT
ncbi:MAG: hypothetical protein AB7G44_13600 [Bacteroidia bacterium]